MPQRRVNLTPRPQRRHKTPAYQVRRRTHADAAPGDREEDRAHLRHQHAPSPSAIRESQAAPEDAAPVHDARFDETSAFAAEATDAAPAQTMSESAAVDDSDLADYARVVEDAAVRERAMLQIEPSRETDTANAASTTTQYAAGESIPTSSTETAIYPAAAPAEHAAQEGRRRARRKGRRGGDVPPPSGRAEAVAPEPNPRPRWKRLKTWAIGISLVLAVAVIAGLVYALYIVLEINNAYDRAHVEATPYTIWTVNDQGTPVPVPTEERALYLPNWGDNDPINILLIGVDYRDGDEQPARSDTIIIVRVEPATKQVTMMNLPRDIYVTIPGHGNDKINAAFALGEHEREGDGPALLSETISYNFNIPINYFVTIDFDGFRKVVNTVGGIVVDVPAPIKDDQYPTENFGLTRVYFPAGLQMMDGETALRYARTRHGDNDIARGDRQQQVLLAIRQQAVSLDLIRNAPALIQQLGDSVRTDLNFNQMLALANLGRSIDSQAITRVNLWELGVLSEHLSQASDDPYYLEVDASQMRDLVAQYFPTKVAAAATTTTPSGTASMSSSATTTPDATTTADTATTTPTATHANYDVPLIVQDNSSDNTGGPKATAILQNAGFTTIAQEMGPTASTSTVIYDYVNEPDTANLIARELGLDSSTVVPGNGGTGILIVVGDDLAGR